MNPDGAPAGVRVSRSGVLDVLGGGGEMGALAREIDWSHTPVGAVEAWPQSLRTAVSILLESKFPMLLCWGPDFVQFYNDPFRPILGSTKHPAIGKSTTETFAEAWHIIGPLFEQVMQGTAVGFDDMLVPLDRNGFLEECYFVYSYSPIREESGRVGGVFVTCTETTGRVVAERRLRTLRELASEAAHAHDEDAAWSAACRVLEANTLDLPFVTLYRLDQGGSTVRVAGTTSPLFAPPTLRIDMANEAWPLFESLSHPVTVTNVQQRFGRHATPDWPESISAAMVLPIRQSGLAQPYGFLVAGLSPRIALDDNYRDFLILVGEQITSTVGDARSYEEEHRQAEALLELDRQKTAFFTNVSHEFRTPLTLLLSPIERALERSPRMLTGDDVDLVHRNALRLLRLVNTLLDFSRIEAGRAEAIFEPVDLAQLTTDIASTFRSVIESGGLEFAVDCPPLEAPVAIDPAMWEKVVLNLLSNAFKFTLQGRVSVRLREQADRIELSVTDTGVGIPPLHVDKIFERFYRIDGTAARTFEGSGIGLALVRELVRMHDGQVNVYTAPGRGSTFTVTLPRTSRAAALPPTMTSTASAAAAPYVEEARRWGADGAVVSESQPEGEHAHGRATVLVVDDNADLRQYVERVLSENWHVETAANGRDALEHIARRPPDLVLTDVMMPDIDGFELLRRLRAQAGTRTIPVMMLSARSGEGARADGLTAGADDYIDKPFTARQLVARIRTQLELAQLRRETEAQNQRLQSLIAQAPAAIAMTRGPAHVFEIANDRYLQLVDRRHVAKRPGREVLPELIGQGVWDLVDRVYETGVPFVAHEYRVDLERHGKDRLDEGYFNFVLQPLTNVRGEREGILVHAVEVTEQVLARRALDDARKLAESANRAKDEFLAMLGHELRNPLAPILTALHLMAARDDRSTAHERAVIERQVRHLVRLVDDLLDVSRIASGKIELKRERADLAVIVGRAIEVAGSLIEQKHHTLEVAVPDGLVVDGDPARLQQIVYNLLNNAAKYTELDGHISITATAADDAIELRVRDSGIGIDSDLLDGVFDLFMQSRQALDRAQGGLGLGLAIVRNLVTLHGGTVTAASHGAGHGSEFTVRLPCAAADVSASTGSPAAAIAATMESQPRVLIVDDNEDSASLFAYALELAGFATRTAGDGIAALATAPDFKPQAALLDLGLPGMDGFELAQRLRELPDPPVLLALTGYGTSNDRHRTEASGFAAHNGQARECRRCHRGVENAPAPVIRNTVRRHTIAHGRAH